MSSFSILAGEKLAMDCMFTQIQPEAMQDSSALPLFFPRFTKQRHAYIFVKIHSIQRLLCKRKRHFRFR